MEDDILELDRSKFFVKKWMCIDIGHQLALLDRKETQELIDFLQKHLHKVKNDRN